jgi:S1-C subfamily serine protease
MIGKEKRNMTQRKIKVVSAVAALSIAVAGAATAQVANAAAPAAVQTVVQAQEERGLIILRVVKDGPAAQAGVKRGDILLKLNESEINDLAGLQDALKALAAGDEVSLRVQRGDGERTYKVKLGEIDGRAYLGVVTEGAAEQTPAVPALPTQPAQPGTPDNQNPQGRQMPFNMQPEFIVSEVVTDSPAAKAGVLKDDLIVAVNGEKFDFGRTLADVIQGFKPGDAVTLTVKRGNEEQDIEVTLGDNPQNNGAAYLGIRYGMTLGGNMMPGMPNNRRPMPMPMPRGDGQGQQGMPFEMPEGMMQVTVGEVTKDSPADKAGLQAGDVISAANGTAVATPDALVKLVQAAKPGDKVNLSIVRDGQDDEIVVTLGENPDKKGAGYMGISLGATMKFENLMPGRQGSNGEGFEIFPGFQLPFDFGGLPFEIPQQTPEQNDTLS